MANLSPEFIVYLAEAGITAQDYLNLPVVDKTPLLTSFKAQGKF